MQITMKLKSLAILLITVVATSCDCLVDHRGFVLDAETEKPIMGAIVQFDKREYKTDSLGYFEISYITGTYPDRDFTVIESKYKNESIKIELDDNEIIYKIKKSNTQMQNNSLD